MDRRQFLRISAVAAAMPLALKGLLPEQASLPSDHASSLDYVELDLFGKRWPVPVYGVPDGDGVCWHTANDLVITVDKPEVIPTVVRIHTHGIKALRSFNRLRGTDVVEVSLLPQSQQMWPGDSLTLKWPGKPVLIVDV